MLKSVITAAASCCGSTHHSRSIVTHAVYGIEAASSSFCFTCQGLADKDDGYWSVGNSPL